jgi:flagellar hook assembly protein FlgD
MAQFTALEQMQNLNTNVAKLLEQQSSLQAPSLLGRNVTVIDVDGEQQSGRVEELEYHLGQPWLMVNGSLYGMNVVQKVFAGEIDE